MDWKVVGESAVALSAAAIAAFVAWRSRPRSEARRLAMQEMQKLTHQVMAVWEDDAKRRELQALVSSKRAEYSGLVPKRVDLALADVMTHFVLRGAHQTDPLGEHFMAYQFGWAEILTPSWASGLSDSGWWYDKRRSRYIRRRLSRRL